MEKNYWAHESSIVSKSAKIGNATKIWQFCNVMDEVEIGEQCNIGQGVFVEKGVKIGNRVKIKNNVALYTGILCEDDVFLGPGCVFTNVKNPRSFIEKKNEFRQTVIKKGATIGANATILCGHTIGAYALVGAGSVVTSDVPEYALVIGNPARVRGYVCRCGEKLNEHGASEYICIKCKKRYIRKGGKFVSEE